MDDELRKETLNRAIGRKNCLQSLKRQIDRELTEAEESVNIWTKDIKEVL